MSDKRSSNSRFKYAAFLAGVVAIGIACYFFIDKALLAFMVGWVFFIPMAGAVYMVHGLQEFRTVSRNVSLSKEHIEKLKPTLEKNKGNFSAAIRDVIYQSPTAGSFKEQMSVDNFVLNWMVKETDGLLLPDNILDEMIDPDLMGSMENLESFLNNKFNELRWDIGIVLKYDSNISPSDVLIEIRGDPQRINLVASMISKFLVKNSVDNMPLKIESTINQDKYMSVELTSSTRNEAISSLATFFGGADEMTGTIKSRPDFWKAVFDSHISSNYNMVTVHRNYFEDLFTDKVPVGEITIENLARKPIREIPLEEMLYLIKQVYESSGIFDKVEISNENLILFHSYRNKDAIERLRKSLVMLLNAGGHIYDARSTANMIILTHTDLC
ncbi:MAG: hypothetical protein KKD46_01015 [Euryarchaeota archaeon]|nr:hypothetical protein [Euryarchaeota archaeon]MBU4339490.1 hypothetical protein [Euryarchaeota archaeon]